MQMAKTLDLDQKSHKTWKKLDKRFFLFYLMSMFRYFILIVVLVLAPGCKSTIEKRINKDITGINEQLYDLEKKQIKDANRLDKLAKDVQQVSSKQQEVNKEDQLKDDVNAVYKEGYKSYLEQNYNDAIKKLASITKMFNEDTVVDNALYWQAESFMKLKQTDRALTHYQILYRYFPFSSKADYALYKIGLIYQEMKDNSRALLAFKRLVSEYPDSDLFKTAQLKVRQLKTKNRRR
jgi:TolA-binding protein